MMLRRLWPLLLLPGLAAASLGAAGPQKVKLSEASEECIECHQSVTPGIVANWRRSRHARTTPAQALAKPETERRFSAKAAPQGLAQVAVGCAECHSGGASHRDRFKHNDRPVHVVVTPADCARCHPTEERQYRQNIMSQAYGNLRSNPLYWQMVNTVNGIRGPAGKIQMPDALSQADSCLQCHGTKVEVKGLVKRETSQGEMAFPVLSGWPNRGVGRINPDGSKGSCGACHNRHRFDIAVARQPYSCGQCHKGPDVPVAKVYAVSRHGGIFKSASSSWNLRQVPWRPGKDFSAPTCAACHVSLLVDPEGEPIAQRSHRMNDRLAWRLFGLPYGHAHPKEPDTSKIRNKDGRPMPTALDGTPAAGFLIDAAEQAKRRGRLQKICLTCHATSWVAGHFKRLDNTMAYSNRSVLAAFKLVQRAWRHKLARPDNLFDEHIERLWAEQWLFYANSVRYASAMMGADYGVFDRGRWQASGNLAAMAD